MPYVPTTVLQLQIKDTASGGTDYADRVAQDQQLSGALVVLDNFAASLTASSYSIFGPTSGSLADLLGQSSDGIGMEYNRGPDRIIQEVVAFCAFTGSSGVTSVDVQVQQGRVQPANFSTVFLNAAARPNLSGGLGGTQNAALIARSAAFVSGVMVWPANTLLRVQMNSAAGQGGARPGRATGLTVQIYWKPSGSYGA